MSDPEQVSVIPVKFNSRVPNGSAHEVFVKLDKSPSNEAVSGFRGRTLLVTNVPPWMGKDELRSLIDPFDSEHIFVQREAGSFKASSDSGMEDYTGFKVAYVVLRSKSEAIEVLTRKIKKPIAVYQDRGTELVGMRKMVESYIKKFEPRSKLEATISEAIAQYDRAQEEEKKAAEKLHAPDDDGWITVTRHGKRPVIPRTEAVQSRLLEKEKLKDKRKKLKDFYTFQAKRSKLNELEELRRKFAEDKRKVALLKMKRKFNPC
ncbi:ribosomal RNA-processing protein 7 homolog A [Galendromus occidentalis]|uniref:Ribosomal RNA-processing protein 7 homolog A n=1 Tax=Galendromus occidentalis TaxID=34638 RepID=A0AAJ6QMK0_9ACAR|nr:ribosomal RNA-processing protein 7 homolog A [Galendromus occidentalis]